MKRAHWSYALSCATSLLRPPPAQASERDDRLPRDKSQTVARYSGKERTALLAVIAALFSLPFAAAQTTGTVINQQYIQGQGAGTNAFLIATLPASTVNTFDHLHLIATLDSTDGSLSNSAIDATFANRNGFAYFYTAKGANPNTNNVHIVAYQQDSASNNPGSVNLYIVLENGYDTVTYTILESQQEQIFSSPSQLNNTTPPGTLIFDTRGGTYPPQNYTDFSGSTVFNGSYIYPGYLGGALYSDADNTVVQAPTGGSVYLVPVGTDGTHVATSGTLVVGGGSPTQSGAQLQFAPSSNGILFSDGSVQTKAWNPNTNVDIGMTGGQAALNVGGTVVIGSGYKGDASLQIVGSQGCCGRFTQIAPAAPSQAALNIMASTDPAGNAQWMTWGVNNGNWTVNPGVSFGAPAFTVASSGNVGIGTSSPTSPLEVTGNITLSAGGGGSIIFPNGVAQSMPWTGVLNGGDYAESVDVSDSNAGYQPGDLIVIDTAHEGKFVASTQPYSKLVAGIYSTKPGVRGRRQTSDMKTSTTEIPMAMVGIVPTRVTAENGPIEPGDLLVTSSATGTAMKGTDSTKLTGAVVGKALGRLEAGTGTIEVLVALQ